jgi:hypothetical protein
MNLGRIFIPYSIRIISKAESFGSIQIEKLAQMLSGQNIHEGAECNQNFMFGLN